MCRSVYGDVTPPLVSQLKIEKLVNDEFIEGLDDT